MGSLALRPGDSLTIPRMALSVGFIRFVSSANATQVTGLLTLALVRLTPTEHASLCWTHWFAKTRSVFKGLKLAKLDEESISHRNPLNNSLFGLTTPV